MSSDSKQITNSPHVATSFGIQVTQKQIDIAFFCVSILGGIGFILNLIGMVVFSRKRFKKCTMGSYNIAIAIVNNIIITVIIWNYVPFYFNINPLTTCLATCILINYLQHCFTVVSSWLDMFITIDRMLGITFPKKFENTKKRKNIYLLTFFVCFISILIHTPFLKYKLVSSSTKLNNTNNTQSKSILCQTDNDNLLTINVITIIFRIMIPFLVMIISNIILINNLKKVKRERYSQKEASFTHSVVALNILFFATHLPFAILVIYQTILKYKQYVLTKYIKITLAYEISVILTSYNYVLPTVINFVFNKLFREEFIKMTTNLLGLKKEKDTTTQKNSKIMHIKDVLDDTNESIGKKGYS